MPLRKLTGYLVLSCMAGWMIWFGDSCQSDNTKPAPYLSLPDSVHEVGMATCISCHNQYPTLLPGSLNKFLTMSAGIEGEILLIRVLKINPEKEGARKALQK